MIYPKRLPEKSPIVKIPNLGHLYPPYPSPSPIPALIPTMIHTNSRGVELGKIIPKRTLSVKNIMPIELMVKILAM
jgi:hypothetical protein